MIASYILSRAIGAGVTVVLASAVVFTMLYIIPGNPAMLILGPDACPDTVDSLTQQMGADRPALLQFISWWKNTIKGDLGSSLYYNRPVTELLLQRLPVTAACTIMAITLLIVIAIPLGIIAACNQNRSIDTFILTITQTLMAIPPFWLAIMLIGLIAVSLRLVPAGGFPGWDQPILAIQSLLLPSVCLSIPRMPVIVRFLRSSFIDALTNDYVRTAHAKGLPTTTILYKHVLKNAFLPTLTIIGIQLAILLTGTIIIEHVFALPGLGRLILQAVSYRDVPLLLGTSIFTAAVICFVNLIIDICYTIFDPRINLTRGHAS